MRTGPRLLAIIGMMLGMIAVPIVASAGTFQVDSRQDWQSTGVIVSKGATFSVAVTGGTWTNDRGVVAYNAGQGWNYTCTNSLPASQCVEPVPSAPQGSLVGKVGNSTFAVGNHATITAPDSGNLFLRINADISQIHNDGVLTVQISVGNQGGQPQAQPSPPGGDIGGPDLRGYCQAQGYIDSNLARNTADAWSCKVADGYSTSIDMAKACNWTYHRSDLIAKPFDFNNAGSWRCYPQSVPAPTTGSIPSCNGDANYITIYNQDGTLQCTDDPQLRQGTPPPSNPPTITVPAPPSNQPQNNAPQFGCISAGTQGPGCAGAPTNSVFSHRYVVFVSGVHSSADPSKDPHQNSDWGSIRDYLLGQFSQSGLTANHLVSFSYFAAVSKNPASPDAKPGKYCAGWDQGCPQDGSDSLTSEALANNPIYSAEDTQANPQWQADALDWLLRQIGRDDPAATIDIIGHSLGGVIAAYWGSQHDGKSEAGQHVHTIVTIDSPLGGVYPAWNLLHNHSGIGVDSFGLSFWGSNVLAALQVPDPTEDTTGSIVGQLPNAAINYPNFTSIQSSSDYLVSGESVDGRAIGIEATAIGIGADYWSLGPSRLLIADLSNGVPHTVVTALLLHGAPLHAQQALTWIAQVARK